MTQMIPSSVNISEDRLEEVFDACILTYPISLRAKGLMEKGAHCALSLVKGAHIKHRAMIVGIRSTRIPTLALSKRELLDENDRQRPDIISISIDRSRGGIGVRRKRGYNWPQGGLQRGVATFGGQQETLQSPERLLDHANRPRSQRCSLSKYLNGCNKLSKED